MIELHGQKDLSSAISAITSESNSQNAVFAISVKNEDGSVAYELQSKSRMIPASTYKLVTTLSAIDLLGSDYIYETKLFYKGAIRDGVLHGDIVIEGSGDPSLGATRYSGDTSYVQALRDATSYVTDAGIHTIKGRIIVDKSLFDQISVHSSWAWDDLTNYYAGGAEAFNIHENLYFLDFNRAALPGQRTEVSGVQPEVPGIKFDNRVVTGPHGSGDNAYIYGDPYATTRWIEGTIPPGEGTFTIKGAMPDPSQAFIHHFTAALKEVRVNVENSVFRYQQDAPEILIGTLCSDQLSDLVLFANHTSNNLFCEAFFKSIGAKFKQIGGYDTGREVIEEYLEANHIDYSGLRLEDGCGLSSRNRISPDFMTSFLTYQVQRHGRAQVQRLIPQPGQQGTVKSFLSSYSVQPHVQLKSGSINNVLAYAGLMTGQSKKNYTISVMANGHDSNRVMRRQLEKIIQTLYIHL